MRPRDSGRRSPWLIGCLVAIIALFVLLICGIMVAILFPTFMKQGVVDTDKSDYLKSPIEKVGKAQAEATLRNVITTADMYSAENGSYDGMDAEILQEYAGDVKLTDGTPKAGEVGISNVTSNGYVLIYMNEQRQSYKATIENGQVEFDFETTGGSKVEVKSRKFCKFLPRSRCPDRYQILLVLNIGW